MEQLIGLVERGFVPDPFVRAGIRRLLAERLRSEEGDGCEDRRERMHALLEDMAASPVALATDTANEQHYELPAGFFEAVLGPDLKYSCCLWTEQTRTLADAEAAMLALTCERAGLESGQDVLELGCGWGALSLWMAEHYPESTFTAVSNSSSQRAFIEARRDERGLGNLTVITADMNDFDTDRGRFDRVVSLEMFEHMRNWRELLRRVHGWLRPGGRLFFHVFCHRDLAYVFQTSGPKDWMGQHFFTDGLMPSAPMPLYLQEHLRLKRHWQVNGQHYEATCNAWLARMDEADERIRSVFAETYGADAVGQWVNRWRVFFMACAELFGFRHGNEWFVSHYLMERPAQDREAQS
ncbi:cyclopropane-fatty-acyl-phospholipid synthase family protein [Aquisalimonas sp.]|uniref:SAM-dependent methyltransferase n=1 Tax=unclassified Aquisalimonas TaxID=2644645 RepID=UPI0025B9C468|nr:cyclopropane-fatty-acyl-phospholipid synthase family protein [Aquisalimonas sp.]